MSSGRSKALLALLLAALTAATLWPAAGNDFVFDDRWPFLAKRELLGGINGDVLGWAVTSTDFSLYSPVARLASILELRLYGDDPFGHHLTSLLLHVAVSFLAFLVLAELTGALWKSAAVSALCAVHPLRVESAAWISAQADLLAALFALLAVLAWSRYLKRRRGVWAAAAVAAFSLGMLSKTIIMALPFALLLLDYWPLGRIRPAGAGGVGPATAVVEKAVFFLVTALLAGVSLLVLQRGTEVVPLDQYTLAARLWTIPVSYATYVVKTLWPMNLTVFYPHHWGAHAWWEVGGAALLLVAASTAVLWAARRRPYLPVGWFWFLVMLLPVIGIYQARLYPVADRYAYVPQLGLFVMAVWGAADLAVAGPRWKILVTSSVAALIIVLIPASRAQVRHWANDVSLFRHALAVTSGNWLAHNNLGEALERQGRHEEAKAQLVEALRLRPEYPEALNNLGALYMGQGRLEEALASCRAALRLWPESAELHYNLGNALLALGRFEEAGAQYREALRLRPAYPDALNNLGILYTRQGRLEEALASCRAALRLEPESADLHHNLGNALLALDRFKEAEAQYREALRLRPAYPHALNNLGICCARQGRLEGAVANFREALRLNPGDSQARANMDRALGLQRAGRSSSASTLSRWPP